MRRILFTLALFLLAFRVSAAQRANVFTNYDLDAVAFVFCDPADIPAAIATCVTGVAAEDGWIVVREDIGKVFTIVIDTMGVTGGIDMTFQVRTIEDDGTMSAAVTLMNLINKTVATTDNQSVRIPDEVAQIRFGMEIGTADDGADAIVEDITVVYNSR